MKKKSPAMRILIIALAGAILLGFIALPIVQSMQ